MKVRDLIYLLQTYGKPDDELFMTGFVHSKNGCSEIAELFDGDFDSICRLGDEAEDDVDDGITYIQCPRLFIDAIKQTILGMNQEPSDAEEAQVTELFPPSTEDLE